MSGNRILRGIVALLTLCVGLPIWLWLLYKILVLVNATELMWFLYWAYVPVTALAQAIFKLTEDA